MLCKITILLISALTFLPAVLHADNPEMERLRRENFILHRRIDSLTRVLSSVQGGISSLDHNPNRNVRTDDGLYSILDKWDDLQGEPTEIEAFKQTPISSIDTLLFIPYDEVVDKYIDIYSQLRKKNMRTILKRYDTFRPMLCEIFDKYDIPRDFTMLCIVESACNTNAVSRAGAIGLWQMTAHAAVENGLTVSINLDERYDARRSTEAAARFLKKAYTQFGSWALALMSYNCGIQRVKNVVTKCNGDLSYENIYTYLPKETREYLPALVAAMYVNVNRQILFQ